MCGGGNEQSVPFFLILGLWKLHAVSDDSDCRPIPYRKTMVRVQAQASCSCVGQTNFQGRLKMFNPQTAAALERLGILSVLVRAAFFFPPCLLGHTHL